MIEKGKKTKQRVKSTDRNMTCINIRHIIKVSHTFLRTLYNITNMFNIDKNKRL